MHPVEQFVASAVPGVVLADLFFSQLTLSQLVFAGIVSSLVAHTPQAVQIFWDPTELVDWMFTKRGMLGFGVGYAAGRYLTYGRGVAVVIGLVASVMSSELHSMPSAEPATRFNGGHRWGPRGTYVWGYRQVRKGDIDGARELGKAE